MLYFLPIIVAYFHYFCWIWKRLRSLQEKVREARKMYTLEDEGYFLSLCMAKDVNSKLGLYKNHPEYKMLVKKRVVYFEDLAKLRELQRSLFFWEDLDMKEIESDDHETWNIKMNYRLKINRKGFFGYYPEYLRSIFGTK